VTDDLHLVLDDTAVLAAGSGNVLASRLIHRAHAEPGWFLYVSACTLVEADRARRGTAEHIATLPGVHVLDLDLPSALAIAHEDTWGIAHTRHEARPSADRPGGAVIVTTAPERWKGHRFIDLTP
jgi:hypothetical protein